VIVNRMKILLGCELTVQGTIRGAVMTRLVHGMDQGALVAPKTWILRLLWASSSILKCDD
jgi:hypothetical protein